MTPAELDRTDLAILALLQREGRLSNADLAERVNLSASATLRRVQRLESEGVIAGYGASASACRRSCGCSWRSTIANRSRASWRSSKAGTRWSPATR
jgi:predicted ArsR family transcriptional regulator